MHSSLGILAIVLMALIFSMPSASADLFGLNDRFDLGWSTKAFFQDLGEGLASIVDGKEVLNKLRVSHLQDAQNEIDKREANGEPIPAAIVERINSKTEQLKSEETIGETLYKTIKTANELNKIRVLHGEFKEVLKSNDPLKKSQFNNKVNNLQTWKDNCTGTFDVNNFKNDKASINKLANDHCPGLKTQTIQQLSRMLYG